MKDKIDSLFLIGLVLGNLIVWIHMGCNSEDNNGKRLDMTIDTSGTVYEGIVADRTVERVSEVTFIHCEYSMHEGEFTHPISVVSPNLLVEDKNIRVGSKIYFKKLFITSHSPTWPANKDLVTAVIGVRMFNIDTTRTDIVRTYKD